MRKIGKTVYVEGTDDVHMDYLDKEYDRVVILGGRVRFTLGKRYKQSVENKGGAFVIDPKGPQHKDYKKATAEKNKKKGKKK